MTVFEEECNQGMRAHVFFVFPFFWGGDNFKLKEKKYKEY